MSTIQQTFSVSYNYPVSFTGDLFNYENSLFADLLTEGQREGTMQKVLFVLDQGMLDHHPSLIKKIKAYHLKYPDLFSLVEEPVIIPGGEEAKNDPAHVDAIVNAINHYGIDRHSYVAAVGGGAVIDTAGYAASIAHRGIRLIRIPTTVLAQNDASIGVKNGVNSYGKKNFLGTFVPPYAVINDSDFLKTLNDRDWRSGISEAVKVALIKDPDFFSFIEENAGRLNSREGDPMQTLIYRCAELHLDHIAGSGDPFETGSSRPLDFGHWAAHKLEQISQYKIRHGEAVAIGIALDTVYSGLNNLLTDHEVKRVLDVLKHCGFQLFVPELDYKLDTPEEKASLLHGLEEFREHLGGELTIMLLEKPGSGIEVHSVDYDLYREAIKILQAYEENALISQDS